MAQIEIEAIPVRHTKVVHFIRHAQGFHNVAGHADPEAYRSFEYEDAHLTAYGWRQAEAVQQHLAGLQQPLQVEVVICSPLTRTLETAVGIFGTTEWTDDMQGTPLMLQQPSRPVRVSHQEGTQHDAALLSSPAEVLLLQGKQEARAAVRATGSPPFVAQELCREHIGRHPCDKRSRTSHYQQQFPAVDFSLVDTEEDVLWTPDVREAPEEIKQRGMQFIQWLMQRPEQHIAVVTHSSFLYFMMQNFGKGAAPLVQKEMHRWYENCELRSLLLSNKAGPSGSVDPVWFPGGDQLSRHGANAYAWP
eukprot:jgi/Astpho2/3056/e_gw1.00051.123.1_t